MGLSQTTPPTEEPLSVSDVNEHLRIDDTEEQGWIVAQIAAARAWAEDYTQRQFVTATYTLTADAFPCGCGFSLPRPPLASVSSITYTDNAGSTQTWASSNYVVSTDTEPGRIRLAYNASYPSDWRCEPDGISIVYVAGYGDPEDVDPRVQLAMLQMIGHWYEHREAVTELQQVNEVPHSAIALLDQIKVWEVV